MLAKSAPGPCVGFALPQSGLQRCPRVQANSNLFNRGAWRRLLHTERAQYQVQALRFTRTINANAGGVESAVSTKIRTDDGRTELKSIRLKAEPVSAEAFRPFGQVVEPVDDGGEFGPQDAQLDLSKGIPRFYIMRLPKTGLTFKRITHHARVTQCLASASPGTWYLAVAPPSLKEGGGWDSPAVDSVRVFSVTGPLALKLHTGTWHAGPLFNDPTMDFFNLELAYTNVDDHHNHFFSRTDGVEFLVEP